ncbi:MAG: hypothetical protein KGZ63_03385 [Clostridiales bacterium]|jgi:hypothetical protein|nr:hypothetical protein [Clostridiales bacterium]
MKRIFPLALFLLVLWTSSTAARLIVFTAEEMLEQAQFILIGEVKELRQDPQLEFVLEVETVYKGEIGMARISVPLRESFGISPVIEVSIEPPYVGARMLLLLRVNEFGRLAPVADLNWAAYVSEGRVSELYLGAAAHQQQEADYVNAFNLFLSENPGKVVTKLPVDDNGDVVNPEKSAGQLTSAIFLMLAGVLLILMVVSAKIKRNSVSRKKSL